MVFLGGGTGWIAAMFVGCTLVVFVLFISVSVKIFRSIFRPFDGATLNPPSHLTDLSSREWNCSRINCRARNAAHARYCRLCGRRRTTRELFDKLA